MAAPTALDVLTRDDAGLGLRAGHVEVVEANQRWADLFQGVSDHLTICLDGLNAQIEHIGSTSVPGLAAKPLLDIAVGAPQPIDANVYIDRLEQAGFEYQADLGIYGGLLFNAKTNSDVIVAHLHVVDIDDFQWSWYLAFRDGLRADEALRTEYAELKQAAADAHRDDREAYTQAKFDWVLKTVRGLTDTEGL